MVGLPDARWGQIVVAAVVPAPGAEPDPEELRSFCRGRLAAYKTPARVAVFAELPRNATGKIVRSVLASSLASSPASSPVAGDSAATGVGG